MEYKKGQQREMVPVIPPWCDYHSYAPKQKVVFIGVTRAILTLIALALCVAYLSVYNTTSGEQITLILLIVLSIVHFFVCLYFIYAGRSRKPQLTGRWLVLDIVISTLFIITVIAFLCIAPASKLHIVVGIKLIVISAWLCFHFSMKYIQFLDQPIQAQNLTANVY